MRIRTSVLALLALVGVGCATPQPEPVTLRVLAYNIKRGYGNDGVADIRRAARFIDDLQVDLVVLQEIDKGVERSGREDQMAILSEVTGMHGRFGAFMPYQGGEYGMGLLSRFPIVESRNHRLPRGTEPRTALDARVALPGGAELVLCSVHLYRTEAERLAQMEAIVEVYVDEAGPMILAGDFNSTPGSGVMELAGAHWTNLDKGADRMTFSATDPQREIDFVLVRPAERFDVRSVDVLEEPVISDHRPILVELVLRGGSS